MKQMEKYRLKIVSTIPSCPWIAELIEDVRLQGGDVACIAWECGALRASEFKKTDRVRRAFEEATTGIKTVYLPFLPLRFHLDRTKNLIDYAFILMNNPSAVVVYDYCDPALSAETAEMDSVLAMLCSHIDPSRILTREQALAKLVEQTCDELCPT